jgi:transposase InsO family protein
VCRFDIPYALVTDNGKQFDCAHFRKWCSELYIRNSYWTPTFPQSIGQVEATNKTLVQILKKKLGQKKGAWVEYLPKVLWSYRTTIRTLTGETPFALTYGMEAVISAEIGSPSFKLAIITLY